MQTPKATKTNPHFKSKYVDLTSLLDAVRPALNKHGIFLSQSPRTDQGRVSTSTLLIHESGEWIECEDLDLPIDKATAQGVGSAITYGRRYSLSAFLGIASEEDDDGNHASEREAKPFSAGITQSQQKKIRAMMAEMGWDRERMVSLTSEQFGVESSRDLTRQQAGEVIDYLQAEKDAREVRDADAG